LTAGIVDNDPVSPQHLGEDWMPWSALTVSATVGEGVAAILALRELHRNQLASEGCASGNLLHALDRLFEHPVITVRTSNEIST
jgi:hypothetical protein